MDQVRGGTQPEKRWRDLRIRLTAPVPLAVLTALALLATFPAVNLGPLAWVALAPLAACLDRPRSPFRDSLAAGWMFGLVYWGGQFSWFGYTMVAQGGVSPWATLLFYVCCGAVLALIPAVSFAAVAAARRIGLSSSVTLPLVFGAMDWLLGAWPFGGVGWGSLAGPQAGTFAAGVTVPVLGGPGLVAALVGVNTAWASLAKRLLTRPSRRAWVAAALLATATVGLQWPLSRDPWSDGAKPGVDASESPGTIRTLLVPGDLTLREMHAAEGSSATLRYYLTRTLAAFSEPRAAEPAEPAEPAERLREVQTQLSREAQTQLSREAQTQLSREAQTQLSREAQTQLSREAQTALDPLGGAPSRPRDTGKATGAATSVPRTLVVWPESAAMQPLDRGHALVDLSDLGTVLDADFLVGSDANDPGRLTNSLFLVTGGRFDFTRYDKRHLVPFGEFIPGGFRWFFGRKVTAGDQDYSPGTQPPIVVWRSPEEGGATLGLAICFESILPRHASDAVQAGAEVLVVAANDAWLPRYAVDRHIQLSALRGREVGRDVLFVSNGGPALRIAAGHVQARSDHAPLFVTAVRHTRRTPWVRWGHWSLLGAAGAVLALAAVGREAHRRTSRS